MEKDFSKFRLWMKHSCACYHDETNGMLYVSPFKPDHIFETVKRAWLEWSEKEYLTKEDWNRILQAMLELKDEEQEDVIRVYMIHKADDEDEDNDIEYDLAKEKDYVDEYIKCISKDIQSIEEEVNRWS